MLRPTFSANAAACVSRLSAQTNAAGSRRRFAVSILRALAFVCVVLGLSEATFGQFGADLFDEFQANTDRTVGFDSEDAHPLQRASSGANWRARVGHLAFKTFGRSDSITHVEVMPMIPLDNAVFFSDWRLYFDNNGQLGGNAGVGYRQWVEELDHVVGASFWYDGDNTSTEYFNQLGLSLEVMGDNWDAFSNVYLPVGSSKRDFSVRNTNSTLNTADNSIRFDQVREVGESMPGIDFEFGFLIPTDFGHEHEIRAYAGGYYFSGDDAEDINGVRVRLQGDVNSNMTAQVEYTDDRTFG
ncbi:MAG: inverse autotransporter beta domain-containing protein, partial [Planctomycetota bacterium]|nr:inverse autotransporter beta domain-containing protein [Planctomycetota bacterium]